VTSGQSTLTAPQRRLRISARCRLRHHGKLLLDQATADMYCEALSEKHYMQVDVDHYDSIPVETRGIPHLAIPGLHSYLDEYYSGMLTLRKTTHPTRSVNGEYPTVQSMGCLPFTPFAQALAPGTMAEVDTTHHFCFRNAADRSDTDGRCYMHDNTLEEAALLRAPLFPRAQMVDYTDNPFELADDHIDSFFNIAATLAILIEERYGDASPHFEKVYQLGASFHGRRPPCLGMQMMADFMVLVNAMYPTSLDIAKPHILSAYATAPSKAHRATRVQRERGDLVEGLQLTDMGLDARDMEEALRYSERFFTYVFPKLCPLITSLTKMNGCYDLSLSQIDEVSTNLEQAVRAAWYIASPDGTLPPEEGHVLEYVLAPEQIQPQHVAPKIVDREQSEGRWEKARGALVGLMPGGYRQLLSLLVASSTMDVTVQVYRNYGGLLFRPSAAPDIMSKEGKPRSDKAISPLGVEGDQMAWGSRSGKLRTCKRQRAAWKANARLLVQLCVNVSRPVPPDERLQSDDSCVEFVRSRAAAHSHSGTRTVEEIEALASFNSIVLAGRAAGGESSSSPNAATRC